MLKKTLFAAASAIALTTTLSLPAKANPFDEGNIFLDPPQEVPEPMTVFGLITFAGGALLTKKRADSQKAE